MERLNGWVQLVRERGPRWAALYGAHRLASRVTNRLESSVIEVEKAAFITGADTLSSSFHTREENARIWDAYDWSGGGEEWTRHAEHRGLDPTRWKRRLIDEVMKPHVSGVVLEIGPGAGRWSVELVELARELVVADISETCLQECRQRLGERVRFHLITDGSLSFLDNDSVDSVWSYDVFVHINPADIETYLTEIARVLVPGGVAVIHHSGEYSEDDDTELSFRSHMTAPFFAHLVGNAGLELMSQDRDRPHKLGDVISVFRKPWAWYPQNAPTDTLLAR